MAPFAPGAFVDALERLHLVDAARLDHVNRLAAVHGDARLLAKQLVQEGILTPFQVDFFQEHVRLEDQAGAAAQEQLVGPAPRISASGTWRPPTPQPTSSACPSRARVQG